MALLAGTALVLTGVLQLVRLASVTGCALYFLLNPLLDGAGSAGIITHAATGRAMLEHPRHQWTILCHGKPRTLRQPW